MQRDYPCRLARAFEILEVKRAGSWQWMELRGVVHLAVVHSPHDLQPHAQVVFIPWWCEPAWVPRASRPNLVIGSPRWHEEFPNYVSCAWNSTWCCFQLGIIKVSKPMYSGCTSRLSEALHAWMGIMSRLQDFSGAVISCHRRKVLKSHDQQQQQQLLFAHTHWSSHCTSPQDLKMCWTTILLTRNDRHRTGRAVVNHDEAWEFTKSLIPRPHWRIMLKILILQTYLSSKPTYIPGYCRSGQPSPAGHCSLGGAQTFPPAPPRSSA